MRHAEGDRLDLEGLTAAEVTAFVLAEARLRTVGSMRALLSPLRSLLRFLFVAGMTPRNLTAAVPGIANPRLAALPKALDAATVAALLGSCDGGTAVGRRDFAILTVMFMVRWRGVVKMVPTRSCWSARAGTCSTRCCSPSSRGRCAGSGQR
ncbi:MAG: hypothetical protein L0K86_05465 [Actinomycetia bacterium]|nr:hypothetical protein [Actinomycetes bacterium]